MTLMLREARGGLKATVGNTLKPDYYFIHIVFCSFLLFSARFLCSIINLDVLKAQTFSMYWPCFEKENIMSDLEGN